MFTAFDVGVAILVLISAILATARGLTREVLSLATWAGSAAIAVWMWQYHPEIAREMIKEELVADIATIVVSFIVALIVLHLITMRIADFVVDSKIGPLDRTLGFVFGALRGVLIAVIVVIFGQWLLGAKLPDWAAESRSLPPLQSFGDSLISALPDDLEASLNKILNRGTGGDEDATTDEPGAAAPNDENGTPPADDGGTDAPEDGTPARTNT